MIACVKCVCARACRRFLFLGVCVRVCVHLCSPEASAMYIIFTFIAVTCCPALLKKDTPRQAISSEDSSNRMRSRAHHVRSGFQKFLKKLGLPTRRLAHIRMHIWPTSRYRPSTQSSYSRSISDDTDQRLNHLTLLSIHQQHGSRAIPPALCPPPP